MKRYDHTDGGMHDDPAGDWVAHAQAEYEITRLARLLYEGCDIVQESIVEVQTLNGEIAQRDARIAELEAAIDKLAAGKGRYHTEANYLALIAVRNKSLHK